MDSAIISGVGGAILGAVVTAGGTWWISVRLDRQRENRRLIAAIGVVAGEIDENMNRLTSGRPQDLTIGDWGHNKAAIAGLALRDESLWVHVRKLYGDIFEAQQNRAALPGSDELQGVRDKLITEQTNLAKEINGFSSLFR